MGRVGNSPQLIKILCRISCKNLGVSVRRSALRGYVDERFSALALITAQHSYPLLCLMQADKDK